MYVYAGFCICAFTVRVQFSLYLLVCNFASCVFVFNVSVFELNVLSVLTHNDSMC